VGFLEPIAARHHAPDIDRHVPWHCLDIVSYSRPVILLRTVQRAAFSCFAAFAAAVLASVTHAAPAHAQGDEQRSAARTAATEGLQALSEGRYKDALDLCTRAESLMHAPTHLLLIARAQVKLGHLVEAQEAYIKVTRDTLAPDAPHAFVDAQRTAAEEQAELAPRVPSLKVDVEGATSEQASVMLNGAPFARALVGLAMPINPGTYTLAAKAPGAEASPVTVTVAEGAKQTVLLSLRALLAPVMAETAPEGQGEPVVSHGHGGVLAAGWTSLAVGVVGLAAGSVFVVLNHSELSDAEGLCSNNVCPPSKKGTIESDASSASTDSSLAWVSYGVGAAGVLAGAALLWAGMRSSGGPPEPPTSSATVMPLVGPRMTGLKVVF